MTKRRARAGRPAARRIPVPRSTKCYGWIPDLPDVRDFRYRAPAITLGALPTYVDLRADCPPIYNQGALGSCTAHAIAGALEFDQMRQQESDVFLPSRLFIYYNERAIEGTTDEDAGAMLRDGIKSVAKQGAPHERIWPYVPRKFRSKPSAGAYTDGARHPALLYRRITQDLAQLKACLTEGFPFVFGFSVYESFESAAVAKSGHATLPTANERLLGGHAVLAVGYDTANERFIARNSWGSSWGLAGYFTIPFAYLMDPNLSDDFWTVTLVR